ncbi:MAG TPA: hypothetical protein VK184_20735 [Nostocaceae cyanobacterium]|nr:hypothetical protein [Nostocaceae cyanobacterium]
MPSKPKVYQIFIAATSDVTEDKNIIREVVDQLNRSHVKSVFLMVKDDDKDLASNSQASRQQSIKSQLIDECHILIGILGINLGTQTAQGMTDIEEQINYAIKQDKYCILYDCEKPVPPSKMDEEQLKKAQEYKKELDKKATLNKYGNDKKLREDINRDIQRAIDEITRKGKKQSTAEQKAKPTKQPINTNPISKTEEDNIDKYLEKCREEPENNTLILQSDSMISKIINRIADEIIARKLDILQEVLVYNNTGRMPGEDKGQFEFIEKLLSDQIKNGSTAPFMLVF